MHKPWMDLPGGLEPAPCKEEGQVRSGQIKTEHEIKEAIEQAEKDIVVTFEEFQRHGKQDAKDALGLLRQKIETLKWVLGEQP